MLQADLMPQTVATHPTAVEDAQRIERALQAERAAAELLQEESSAQRACEAARAKKQRQKQRKQVRLWHLMVCRNMLTGLLSCRRPSSSRTPPLWCSSSRLQRPLSSLRLPGCQLSRMQQQLRQTALQLRPACSRQRAVPRQLPSSAQLKFHCSQQTPGLSLMLQASGRPPSAEASVAADELRLLQKQVRATAAAAL